MKIMIPIFSFGKGGGFKVLTKLANYWHSQNHKVVFIVTSTYEKPYYNVNCDIIFLYEKNNKKCTNKYLSFLNDIVTLTKFLKKNSEDYDAIIANWCLTVYPVFFSSKTLNIYYIQAYEPDFFNDINNIVIRSILKFLAWLTYFIPMVRIVNADCYVKYKNIKSSHIVYPGIDLDIYYQKELKSKKANEIFKIGCIGRKEKWKGSQDVADAISYLYNNGIRNIEFIVAFNPVINNKYVITYPDSDESLAEYYRGLDILIAPGHIQLNAIHYPVIEAMAVNTPLITTGYFPANKTNSFIVEVKKPISIAEKILFIMNNYEQAIEKAKLANDQVKIFAWNVVGDKFINIIQNERSNSSYKTKTRSFIFHSCNTKQQAKAGRFSRD